MNVIKYKTQLFELEISLDTTGLAEIRKDGERIDLGLTDKEVYAAVIALALEQYGAGEVHDEESNVITLNQRVTDWNAKVHTMGRAPRLK